jgi:hypothetical protein
MSKNRSRTRKRKRSRNGYKSRNKNRSKNRNRQFSSHFECAESVFELILSSKLAIERKYKQGE